MVTDHIVAVRYLPVVAPYLTVVSNVMSDVTSKAREFSINYKRSILSERGDRTGGLDVESTSYGLVTGDHG